MEDEVTKQGSWGRDGEEAGNKATLSEGRWLQNDLEEVTGDHSSEGSGWF